MEDRKRRKFHLREEKLGWMIITRVVQIGQCRCGLLIKTQAPVGIRPIYDKIEPMSAQPSPL